MTSSGSPSWVAPRRDCSASVIDWAATSPGTCRTSLEGSIAMKRTKATPAPEPVASAPRHRSRYKENRKAKTALNAERCEHRARTALVLGGGAPNMALMAGAVAAFHDCGVEFDVVSTSGAGGLAGLLW